MSDSILGMTSARKAAETKASIHSCANMDISCSMVIEMVDKIRDMEAQLSKSQWVSVEDRLPENENEHLVSDDEKEIWLAVYTDTYDIMNWYDMSAAPVRNVTHWMPLPEPPQ